MPTSKTAQTEKPTFVFKGTVKKLKSATMKTVAVDSNTVIVTVDQLIEAPPDLAGYAGQEITVQLSGAVKPKVGQQMIFHTVSGQYGESIEVRSLSEELVQAGHSALLSAAAAGDPIERRRETDRRRQFDDADLVVSGKVLAVTLPPSEQAATKGASKSALAVAPTRRKPVSEHDPKWRDAVVEVDDVHKGKHTKKKVIVRFPASTDVMWYNAPKFHPGQKGHFLLHKTKVKKPAKGGKAAKKSAAAAAPAETMDNYVALDPLDFQPISEPGGIKNIIDSKKK
jgi:hypothetical protein